jgi:hypothetical protein
MDFEKLFFGEAEFAAQPYFSTTRRLYMTLNEGILGSDTKILMKSEMLRQLDLLKQTTPDEWERAVFESLTGYRREDVDWDVQDNQAGYYTWIRSFDQLISELEDDGYVEVVDKGGNRKVLMKTKWEPIIDYAQFVYLPRQPA